MRILSPIIRYYDRRFAATLIAVLLYAVNSTVGAAQTPELILPRHRLLPAELAVIVNDRDPLSVQIGDYYRRVRGIDPQTGQYFDDTKQYVDNLGLSQEDLYKVYEGNARRVYPRLDKHLKAKGK